MVRSSDYTFFKERHKLKLKPDRILCLYKCWMTIIRRNPDSEQKATLWTTTDFPCSPAEVRKACSDSTASQGCLLFSVSFCSILGRLKSRVKRYHLKTAVGSGVFGHNCSMLQKGSAFAYGDRNVLTTTKLPSASIHSFSSAVEHCQQNSKRIWDLMFQTNAMQSAERTEPHHLLGGVNVSSWSLNYMRTKQGFWFTLWAFPF